MTKADAAEAFNLGGQFCMAVEQGTKWGEALDYLFLMEEFWATH